MSHALRLHAVTLPVPDLAEAEKFYRWVLAMKASAEDPVEGRASLAWGKEDRIVLVDAEAEPGTREAIGLRLEAAEPAATSAWLAERALFPSRIVAFRDDLDEMEGLWPDACVEPDDDTARSNRYVISLDAPADVRVDLHVPLPSATVVERGRHGPFYRRAKDWSGLENPGLLGVTLGAAEPDALVAFLESLGIAPMSPDADPRGDGELEPPLLVGDHQVRVERREPPGIYGTACVVGAARLPDLVRTLDQFGARHRHEKNHLLAVDPAGRLLAVNGVRSG